MYQDIKGKTALITGSGKRTGIGFAIAGKLASCGTNVIIADLGGKTDEDGEVKTGTRDEMDDIAQSLSREFGVKSLSVNLDVTSTESINRMITRVTEHFESIDVLCNNAGATFGAPGAIHAYDENDWMRTIDVNLHGVFRVSSAVLPLMQKAGGSIINTASRAGKVPPIANGAYAVAKAGVIMLSKVMARELAGSGIRVNAICPGQIMTDLEKWRFGLEAKLLNTTIEEREKTMCKTIPLNRIGTIDEVASLVAFLASRESSYITGQAINICGGQLMEL